MPVSSQLSRSQRAADAVTEFCGSWTFIIAFSILTAGWIGVNSALILARVFDPYPYILLNLILTVVSTFQSPLIMMSQNRQMERDRDAVQGLHAKLDALPDKLTKPYYELKVPELVLHLRERSSSLAVETAGQSANKEPAD
jgi:uncharacterized membrane protein